MGDLGFGFDLQEGPGGGTTGSAGTIAAVLGVIAKIASALWNAIKAVFNFLYGLLKPLIKFLQHIWDGFFKKIFTSFFRGVLRLHDWLEAKLGPVIKFLKRVRDWYDRFYKKWVRPVLNTIQHIRRVLLILRALHIKWATALDKRLFDIETKIAGVFLTIRAHLNGVIDLLNVIIDPAKILKHPTIIISVRRSIPGIFRVVTGLPMGYFLPSSLVGATPDERPIACGQTPQKIAALLESPVPDAVEVPGLSLLGPDSPDGYTQEDLSGIEPLDYFAPGGEIFHRCAADIITLGTEEEDLQESIAKGVGEWVAVGELARIAFNELVP